ncbi:MULTISPECIES: hypothetical protein [Rhodomicrobium]|uniref:hypothetical protein n=1 Tax=Rhodomicrobium TaxID=1068 RepID=UPI000B4ABD9A|nr:MULTISPECIES: hypothetical protein [Rhodomicrobium]
MTDDKPDKADLFAHPSLTEFDYKPLLVALRECRFRVAEFMGRTGPRNPAHIEGESLLAYIDAVARLTRVPGAMKFIKQRPKEPGGKWPATKPAEDER